MSVAVYRVTEKKCATCRWWQGIRGVELRGYQPYYVKVEAGPAPCMALSGQQRTPTTTCPRWAKWEKL